MRLIYLTCFFFYVAAAFSAPLDDAKKCFERYVALEVAFDPAAADLYADEAKIQNIRTYPTGQKREQTMPASAYKQLIRQVMPLAKQRGDTNTYSEVKIVPEGDRFRVTASRYSNLKKYSSPLSLLIDPNKAGVWLVYEELVETRP